ncbi:MAG: ADP-ribosylation factor-like protein [Candidatus Thorarchaeota archaeon]
MIHNTFLIRISTQEILARSKYWPVKVDDSSAIEFLRTREELRGQDWSLAKMPLLIGSDKFIGLDVESDILLAYVSDPSEDDPSLTDRLGVAVKALSSRLKKSGLKSMIENYETLIEPSIITKLKIALVGEGGVGKTTTLHLLMGETPPTQYVPTIALNLETVENIRFGNYSLVLWDFAGQERFRKLWKFYFHGADVIFLICDSSLRNVIVSKDILKLIKRDAPKVPLFCMANKQDKPNAMRPEVVQKILGVPTYPMVAIDKSRRDEMLRILMNATAQYVGVMLPDLPASELLQFTDKATEDAVAGYDDEEEDVEYVLVDEDGQVIEDEDEYEIIEEDAEDDEEELVTTVVSSEEDIEDEDEIEVEDIVVESVVDKEIDTPASDLDYDDEDDEDEIEVDEIIITQIGAAEIVEKPEESDEEPEEEHVISELAITEGTEELDPSGAEIAVDGQSGLDESKGFEVITEDSVVDMENEHIVHEPEVAVAIEEHETPESEIVTTVPSGFDESKGFELVTEGESDDIDSTVDISKEPEVIETPPVSIPTEPVESFEDLDDDPGPPTAGIDIAVELISDALDADDIISEEIARTPKEELDEAIGAFSCEEVILLEGESEETEELASETIKELDDILGAIESISEKIPEEKTTDTDDELDDEMDELDAMFASFDDSDED